MAKIFYESTDDVYTEADAKAGRGPNGEVNEQHPLPVQSTWRPEGQDEFVQVDEAHGLPVKLTGGVADPKPVFISPETQIPGIGVGAAYGGTVAAPEAVGGLGFIATPTSGILQWATFRDYSDQGITMYVLLSTEPFTVQADNAAFTLTAAQLTSMPKVLRFTTFDDLVSCRLSEDGPIGMPFGTTRGGFYFQAFTPGAPTVAAGLIPTIQLRILPD